MHVTWQLTTGNDWKESYVLRGVYSLSLGHNVCTQYLDSKAPDLEFMSIRSFEKDYINIYLSECVL